MKILNPIVRVCADCRVVRVRGRVILKHYGSQRCSSLRAVSPRPKLFVAKCRCGCGMWAAFKTHLLTLDDYGRYREQGMYESSWRQALRNAIQWTTQPTESLEVLEP